MNNLFSTSKHLEDADESTSVELNREKVLQQIPDKVRDVIRGFELTNKQLIKASCMFDALNAFGYLYPCRPKSKAPHTDFLPDANGDPFWTEWEQRQFITKHCRVKERSVWELVEWLDYDPKVNYAIFTGLKADNNEVLTVVDVDQPKKFLKLRESKRKPLPLSGSLDIKTNRGKHFYYYSKQALGAYSISDNLDNEISAIESSFKRVVIGPGSLHESGECYYARDRDLEIKTLSSEDARKVKSFFKYYGSKSKPVSELRDKNFIQSSDISLPSDISSQVASNTKGNSLFNKFSSCTNDTKWYKLSENPEWEPAYSFEDVIETPWRRIANDGLMAKRVLKYLGRDIGRINETFDCLLHAEDNSSCTVYRGDQTDKPFIGICDHHDHGDKLYTLPRYYYGVIRGIEPPKLDSGELKIWFYRMLLETGVAEAPPEIDFNTGRNFELDTRKYLLNNFLYLLRMNKYIAPNGGWKLVPFSCRFGARWSEEIGSKNTVSDALDDLTPEYLKCYIEPDDQRKLRWFGLGEKADDELKPSEELVDKKFKKNNRNFQYDEIFNRFGE